MLFRFRTDGGSIALRGPGDIEQAHSNEEWISRAQIHAAYRMYVLAAAPLCVRKEERRLTMPARSIQCVFW